MTRRNFLKMAVATLATGAAYEIIIPDHSERAKLYGKDAPVGSIFMNTATDGIYVYDGEEWQIVENFETNCFIPG